MGRNPYGIANTRPSFLAYVAKDSMKFKFTAKHRGIWPATWTCGVLDVSPSSFIAGVGGNQAIEHLHDENSIRDIRHSFSDSGESYDVRRIWLDLLDWGCDVG